MWATIGTLMLSKSVTCASDRLLYVNSQGVK